MDLNGPVTLLGHSHATAAHLTTDLKDYSRLLPPMAGHARVAVPVDLHLRKKEPAK